MQSISKWKQAANPLAVGTLVLLADERYPPGKWPLARVSRTRPGPDGLVRVVTVPTAANVGFKRPVVKLSLLHIS